MACPEPAPTNFATTFRQRFAHLFGRKIARQRAEQYLAALLAGTADRRDVTSLARAADGATARALGWLLNKSPWETAPIVEALQAYHGASCGTPDGLFTLSLDCFIKRGDNAVGTDRQHVAHLGRDANCQIGVFMSYSSEGASALVDAELYLPSTWTDDPARRRRAGLPDSVTYQTRAELALGLLGRARALGQLPGPWVTTWRGRGFEPDLRERLDAAGWWYLLPADPASVLRESPDGPLASPATLHADASTRDRLPCRVWEVAPGHPARGRWLLAARNEQTGQPELLLSNAPESIPAAVLLRLLATRERTAQALAASAERGGLDVYRVRGWEGWHRHVTLALLASVLRAGLSRLPEDAADLAPAAGAGWSPDHAPAASAPEHTVAAIDSTPATYSSSSIDWDAGMSEPHATPEDATVAPEPLPGAPPAVAEQTTYVLQVELDEADWRAVRAFQVLLVAEEAGEILASSPSRADIENQHVGASMEIRLRSARSEAELRAALDEVPEMTVRSLVAQTEPLAAGEPPVALTAADMAEHADDLTDPEALIAALESELAARSAARGGDRATAIDRAADAVAANVSDIHAARAAQAEAPELIGAGAHAPHALQPNGHLNGGADLARGSLAVPAAPPAPPAEAPVRPTPSPVPVPGPAPFGGSPAAPAPTTQPTTGPAPLTDPEAERRAALAEQQMVILDVGEESYGVPVQRVREIIRVPPITRVPNGPAFLEGVINLRGQVIPVMDLRRHFGVDITDGTRRSRVVVAELGRHAVGLIVDGVSQVVMVASRDIEPPPALVAGANDGQIRGVARLGERLVLFLDPDRMLPD